MLLTQPCRERQGFPFVVSELTVGGPLHGLWHQALTAAVRAGGSAESGRCNPPTLKVKSPGRAAWQQSCELKGLQWFDVDLFAKTLTSRKSKTDAGERVVPLTDVVASALARLRQRTEGFGTVEPPHHVFAAFVPKFTFSGKKVIDYNVTGFDPTRPVKSWRSAWRTLTKKAGLPGFRFHDLRHCAITQPAENGTSDSTVMAIARHVSRRMLERYSHVRMEAKR